MLQRKWKGIFVAVYFTNHSLCKSNSRNTIEWLKIFFVEMEGISQNDSVFVWIIMFQCMPSYIKPHTFTSKEEREREQMWDWYRYAIHLYPPYLYSQSVVRAWALLECIPSVSFPFSTNLSYCSPSRHPIVHPHMHLFYKCTCLCPWQYNELDDSFNDSYSPVVKN